MTMRNSCKVKCLLCREAESTCAEQRALADAAHARMQAHASAEAAVTAGAAALQASLSAMAADLTRMHAAADAAAIERNALHVALQVRPQRGCCCTCDNTHWGTVILPGYTFSVLDSSEMCFAGSLMLVVEVRSATRIRKHMYSTPSSNI